MVHLKNNYEESIPTLVNKRPQIRNLSIGRDFSESPNKHLELLVHLLHKKIILLLV